MEPVLISALEHWSYCPRQCGLIHLESVWDENVLTLRGTAVHERVDEPIARSERGKRVERALPIWSDRYGLQGRADVVECLRDGTPYPVEYKSGKPTKHPHASIQLTAQAICLEEMFERSVRLGALYFSASGVRVEVEIDETLRAWTLSMAQEVRRMVASGKLPPAKFDRRCQNCSLIDACVPKAVGNARETLADRLFVPAKEVALP